MILEQRPRAFTIETSLNDSRQATAMYTTKSSCETFTKTKTYKSSRGPKMLRGWDSQRQRGPMAGGEGTGARSSYLGWRAWQGQKAAVRAWLRVGWAIPRLAPLAQVGYSPHPQSGLRLPSLPPRGSLTPPTVWEFKFEESALQPARLARSGTASPCDSRKLGVAPTARTMLFPQKKGNPKRPRVPRAPL